MEMELRALHAWLQGDPKTAGSWFQKATELESNTNYAYGPPPIVYPSFELYGEWLLEQDRAAEALQQFEKALEKGPKRAPALRGKLRAAEMLNDAATASEVRQVMEEVERSIRREDWLSLR
jgi:tetratricopeptide (TPR) repeat protein